MVIIESTTEVPLTHRGETQPEFTNSVSEKKDKQKLTTDAHRHTRTRLKNYQPRTHTDIHGLG